MTRVLMLTIVAAVAALSATDALAIGELKKEWGNKYAADGQYKVDARKAGCYVCHVKGVKDKKSEEGRNEYGKAMAAYLKSKNVKIDDLKAKYKNDATKKEAIDDMIAMFEASNKEKSSDGETFGAKIAAGKLPATDSGL